MSLGKRHKLYNVEHWLRRVHRIYKSNYDSSKNNELKLNGNTENVYELIKLFYSYFFQVNYKFNCRLCN